jgi:Zn-dependent protease
MHNDAADPDFLLLYAVIGGILAVAFGLWSLSILVVARSIMRMVIVSANPEETDTANLPAYFAPFVRAAQEELERAGFRVRRHLMLRRRHLSVFDSPQLEMIDASGETRVLLEVPLNPASPEIPIVVFESIEQDGVTLLTSANPWSTLPEPPSDMVFEHLPGSSLSTILQRHRARIEQRRRRGRRMLVLDPESALEHKKKASTAAIAEFEKRKLGFVRPDGSMGVRFWPALRAAIRHLDPDRRRRPRAREPFYATPYEPPDTQAYIEHDVACLRFCLHEPRPESAPLLKAIGSLATLVVFYLALGLNASMETALAFTAVVLLHEGGHILAMGAFGMKDPQVLFLPFLGAVAMARENFALAPWKDVVISLAGPLPGLLAGLLVLAFAPDDATILRSAGGIAFALNAFNLLPFVPLDGGRVIEHALGARLRKILPVLHGLSGVALIAAGVIFHLGVFLTVLGILVLLGVPREFRIAEVLRELDRTLSTDTGEDERLRRISASLRTGAWRGLRPLARLKTALRLHRLLLRPRPGAGTALLAGAGLTSPVWFILLLRAVVSALR